MSEARLKRILVGIDLLQSHNGTLSPPVAEAVKQALALAERCGSEVTFFAAIDLPGEDETDLPAIDRGQIVSQVEASARQRLDGLVQQADLRGVRAVGKLSDGQGWIELTREAIVGEYDLVVVGSRNLGAARRALFGSTGMKLLRNCPRPVWVAKPEPQKAPKNLLVASDFSEVADQALRLAHLIASTSGAKLHLIHVLERPYAQLWDAGLIEARREAVLHAEARAAAQKQLDDQLARVLGAEVPDTVVSLVENPAIADAGVLQYIGDHKIDLLVMGTMARRGIAGFFIGNTAEWLLAMAPCSLLAVKPTDFVCQARLESRHYAEPTAYL